MKEDLLVGLSGVLILGIGAWWLAWRIHLPSILLLLIFGFVAGPITGFLNPDLLLGDLLVPIVSISVAIILFEGGLSLQIREWKKTGGVIRNLVTVGLLLTWIIIFAAARYILKLDMALSALIGIILVVTGPTVVIPLLRYVRPSGQVSSILKWEAIFNDAFGAILTVLVFQIILADDLQKAPSMILWGVGKTIVISVVAGGFGALILVHLLKRYWVPNFLDNPVTLILVLFVYALSNHLQEESGLLSVSVMGLILANQNLVNVRHIIEFKENLRILLISTVFILLSARLNLNDLAHIKIDDSLIFLAILIFLARPAAVFISTIGSELNWRERIFLSWMAPRGIIAAAVSSILSLRLIEAGHPNSELLLPLTFMVIISTVAIYGLTAIPVAHFLGVATASPQGAIIVGAHPWGIEIGKAIKSENLQVLIADTNHSNLVKAKMSGLKTYHGSILTEYAKNEIDLNGIGKILAITPNDEANSLAAVHFAELFGRQETYQTVPQSGDEKDHETGIPRHLRGQLLFSPKYTCNDISRFFREGAIIKNTRLTKEFNYEAFQKLHKNKALPLFLVTEAHDLLVFTRSRQHKPRPGQVLISLIMKNEPPEKVENPIESKKPAEAKISET